MRYLDFINERNKKMSKFKVGDKIIGNEKAGRYAGWKGTVIEITGPNSFTAKGDPLPSMETNVPYIVKGSIHPEHYDLIQDSKKIVVTFAGATTTAKLYDGKKLIKTAEAKCSPEDKFDFKIGASLAVERLLGEPKKSPQFDKSLLTTGRFGCVCKDQWFVMVNDKLIYSSGGFDELIAISDGGKFPSGRKITRIVEAASFNDACGPLAKVLWSREEN